MSFFFFRKNKYTASIIILTAGAFFARFFVSGLDQFLHIWDEAYHAVVAKNMMSHPFIPMLYANPVLPYDDNCWIYSHIWLHKQPLFLWLMAISLKIFGINEMGVRMPSVILSALITPMIFRIGKLTINEKAGYYSAFLFALSSYMLEVASGYYASDHNDATFIFFVTGSFWSWFEFRSSGNKKWLYIIGMFAGMAVLVKWVMGLLIFFPWALTILFNKGKKESIKSFKEILTSALIAAIVFLPWQVYILIRFTKQALFAYSAFSEHLNTVVEGHDGTPFFYFEFISKQYGWFVPFILGLSIYLLFKKLKGKKEYSIILFSWVTVTYLVFTIAKTKMDLFVLICSPVIFLSLGVLMSEVAGLIEPLGRTHLRFRRILSAFSIWALFIITGYCNLNINRLEDEHTDNNRFSDKRLEFLQNTHIANAFKNIDKQIPGKDYVIFNCCCNLPPTLMFYSGMTTYELLPDKELIVKLKKQGIKMAFLGNGNVPDYILNDPDLIKLNTGKGPD